MVIRPDPTVERIKRTGRERRAKAIRDSYLSYLTGQKKERTPEEQAAILRKARRIRTKILKEGTKQTRPIKGAGEQ